MRAVSANREARRCERSRAGREPTTERVSLDDARDLLSELTDRQLADGSPHRRRSGARCAVGAGAGQVPSGMRQNAANDRDRLYSDVAWERDVLDERAESLATMRQSFECSTERDERAAWLELPLLRRHDAGQGPACQRLRARLS